MTDTSYENGDRAPQIPGAEPVAPTVTVSGPPGWSGKVTTYNWPASENVLNRYLVWVKPDGALVVADDITPDEVQAAIDLLLAQAGAIE